MTTFAHLFTRAALSIVIVAALLSATPLQAAQTAENQQGIWMASSSTEPAVGTNWGRLSLRDGVLAFGSPQQEWQIPIAAIKRVSISAESDRLIVIEDADSRVYYVAILDGKLLVSSPRKALDFIRRAAQVPSARRY
jgi:hypothetical protein